MLPRFVHALTAGLLLAVCAGCSAPAAPPAPGQEQGLEIVGIQLLAGGDLARLDYRVLDIERARAALSGEVRLESESGATLSVMSVGRLGPMRQRPSATGKLQFILFTNPGRRLHRGESATVALGDTRVSGVPVS